MRDRGTILVVDDEPAVRKLMEISLSRAGYRVFAASDGPEALRICAQMGNEIDLAILDGIMPGANGPDILQALRERYPHLPALFVSGFAQEGELRGMLNERFLKKPFSAAELIKLATEALQTQSTPTLP